MSEDAYPNPLRLKTKIKGQLAKKRPFDSPPINGTEYWFLTADDYPNVCFDEVMYLAEHEEWVNRQSALDGEGFQLLADHYGVDRDAPDLIQQVALHVCRDFVPFFKMKPSTSSIRRTGKQNSWTALSRQLALVRVEMEQRQSKSTKFDAMEVVAKEFYNNAELRSQINKAEKFRDFGKYVNSVSLDDLVQLEKSLITGNDMAQLEHEIWAGDADEPMRRKHNELRGEMEKRNLIPREK